LDVQLGAIEKLIKYAQITNPLGEQVFRDLEQHPKIVRIS
jgi:hypothetical protein